MRLIVPILALGLFLSSTFLGWTFWIHSRISSEDLKVSEGILDRDPKIIKDEYGLNVIGMRIFLQGDKIPLSIPGKILRTCKPEVFDLAEGDRVVFREKIQPNKLTFDLQRRLVFGLEHSGKVLLQEETALQKHRQPNKWMMAMTIIMAASGMALFMFKR